MSLKRIYPCASTFNADELYADENSAMKAEILS